MKKRADNKNTLSRSQRIQSLFETGKYKATQMFYILKRKLKISRSTVYKTVQKLKKGEYKKIGSNYLHKAVPRTLTHGRIDANKLYNKKAKKQIIDIPLTCKLYVFIKVEFNLKDTVLVNNTNNSAHHYDNIQQRTLQLYIYF
ncbi:hypothetical protein ABPG72_014016 [Tetrahymena utriculariae]